MSKEELNQNELNDETGGLINKKNVEECKDCFSEANNIFSGYDALLGSNAIYINLKNVFSDAFNAFNASRFEKAYSSITNLLLY